MLAGWNFLVSAWVMYWVRLPLAEPLGAGVGACPCAMDAA